jgi:hypothetical protein
MGVYQLSNGDKEIFFSAVERPKREAEHLSASNVGVQNTSTPEHIFLARSSTVFSDSLFTFIQSSFVSFGALGVQLLETLGYKPDGRGFDSR